MKTEHWLKKALLAFQSNDPAKQHDGWTELSHVAGKSMYSCESTTEAIAQSYLFHCNQEEQDKFCKELKRLIKNAKVVGLSLSTMNTIIYVIARIEKQSDFAEILSRTLVANWNDAEDRDLLACTFLGCYKMVGKSDESYEAMLFVQKSGWISVRYSVDVCSVLLATNPKMWLSTLSRMIPIINPLRNKVMRMNDQEELEAWLQAEEGLLSQLKSIQVT